MSEYADRIDELYAQARTDQAAFEPPSEPPDTEQALKFLRTGAGQAVGVYIDARTNELVRFDKAEFARLERAMNIWFELYAQAYGQAITADFSVREAAEALLETHNIHDVARILTHVPVDRKAPSNSSSQ
jgi:hypothetical protein